LKGLEAYSQARPPLTERLSIYEAAILAEATGCPINLLHLSSALALQAGIETRRQHPHLKIKLETTLHHLALTYDTAGGIKGKVNPPIRTQRDADSLWQGLLDGEVDTVVSDHACCFEENKGDDLWTALPGFGGSTLLYPVLLSEGYHKRKLSLTRIAELAAANPAVNFGLYPRKGTLVVGGDADFAIVDLEKKQTVTTGLLQSAQDFTPFQGIEITGWPTEAVLRGQVVFSNGKIIARPGVGEYIKRPVGLHGNTEGRS
jgi:dihydropyrimidinase/allantoinase